MSPLTTPTTIGDPIWAQPIEAIAGRYETDLSDGLTTVEATRRLAIDGPNQLDAQPPERMWHRAARQFTDPLVLLLLAAIAISLIAWQVDGGDATPVEALVIAVIVIVNAAIGAWQEVRAERAVEALQRMAETHVTAIRDGRSTELPSRELVRGDVVALAAGDAIAADCRIVEAAALEVAEAALTGESAPVAKSTSIVAIDAPVAERTSMAFGGTAVTGGRARAVVTGTGMSTEIGRIAALLGGDDEPTPLQREMRWLGRALGVVVVALALAVVAALLATSDIDGLGDTVDVLLVGVSLAVAAVPEGLPAILTVVLALGVQRMAARRAVVKQLSSVETLGAASVVCSDKTGTLTRNEMAIVAIVTPEDETRLTGSGYDPTGELLVEHGTCGPTARLDAERIVVAGAVASDATFERDREGWRVAGDPTEVAFLVAATKLDLDGRRHATRLGELPFDTERRMMSVVVAPGAHGLGDDGPALVSKGAPESVLARCSSYRIGDVTMQLDEPVRDALVDSIARLAARGLRTLAVATRPFIDNPAHVHADDESDLSLLGIVGIVDPPRPEAAQAVADAHRGGVRVIMITGDHPQTAASIAGELGIGDGSAVRTGRELAAIDDDELPAAVATTDVFARVEPTDKLRLVRALQRDGRVVAMTGDGVNDAPALRQADIGVAMGVTGTEVAKEASDMILADDDFATIVVAVREGREIFANIRKFLRYLLASNAGEVLVVVFGVLLAGAIGLDAAGVDGELAVPLLATQILWINLLTDSALALALGVDPSVDDVMASPPRRLGSRVIDRSMLVTIAVIGITTAVAGLIALDLTLAGGWLGGDGDIQTARTMVFTTVVLAQVANAFNARSDRRSVLVEPFANRLLWLAASVTVMAQVAVVHVRPLGRAFDTVPLSVGQWALSAALASSVVVVEEIRKRIMR